MLSHLSITINTKVKIPTTGCLLTDKGSFCFDGSMFQSSYTHKGSAHYTSYIGGKKYTYSMQEIDDEDKKLFSDKGEVNLEGIKYKCTVESAPSPVKRTSKELIRKHGNLIIGLFLLVMMESQFPLLRLRNQMNHLCMCQVHIH